MATSIPLGSVSQLYIKILFVAESFMLKATEELVDFVGKDLYGYGVHIVVLHCLITHIKKIKTCDNGGSHPPKNSSFLDSGKLHQDKLIII